MYTAVPAPHMDVQVSREAGCRKRPLRAPCIRSLRDHACYAGCAFPSPLRGSLGRATRYGFKRFPMFANRNSLPALPRHSRGMTLIDVILVIVMIGAVLPFLTNRLLGGADKHKFSLANSQEHALAGKIYQ